LTPKEYGVEGANRQHKFLNVLDERLALSPYIAGEHFSIADITALCAIGLFWPSSKN